MADYFPGEPMEVTLGRMDTKLDNILERIDRQDTVVERLTTKVDGHSTEITVLRTQAATTAAHATQALAAKSMSWTAAGAIGTVVGSLATALITVWLHR